MEKLDRSSWGSGPWDNEPDYHEVRYRGYKIVLSRLPIGCWSAQIGVPIKSKWSKEEFYSQIETAGCVVWTLRESPGGKSKDCNMHLCFVYSNVGDVFPEFPLDKTTYKTMKHVIQDMKRVVKQIERE